MNVFALPLKHWLGLIVFLQIHPNLVSPACSLLVFEQWQRAGMCAGSWRASFSAAASTPSEQNNFDFWSGKDRKEAKKNPQKGLICGVAAQCKQVLMVLQLKKDAAPRLMRGGHCSSPSLLQPELNKRGNVWRIPQHERLWQCCPPAKSWKPSGCSAAFRAHL